MYLKHLTINGFKSFAKKSELEFTSSITGIVGPNGSGKSNVAEGFRFVLGEQSPSKMRGKKGEDMIWGGSDQISRGNRASVSITLDNSKRVFPVDFDEIILERVVHRDGQNEYLVNGSVVRLKDVQEILASANIGPSGHHIISQGEADRILSANTRERKEMIEDALGLKVYQLKKNEAERKLEKTKENIGKVESLRREVLPHLRFLEKQVKKMERAVEQKEHLNTAYAEYLKREDVYLSIWHKRLDIERDPLTKELKEIEQSLEKARVTLESKQHDSQRDQLVEVEKNLSEQRNERQNLLRQLGTIEGQMSYLERQIKTKLALAESDKNISVQYSEIENLVTSLEKDTEKALKHEDTNLLRRALSDVANSLRQFLVRVADRGNRTLPLEEKNELEVLRSQKADLDNDLKKVEKNEFEAESEYNNIRTNIESDQTESREAEREVFRLINERRECESKLTQLDLETNTLRRDQDDFKREIQEAVALLGRTASDYMEYKIEVDGHKLSNEKIVTEERHFQIERRRQLEKLKIRLEELGGANEEIEREYKNVKERDDFLEREIADLTSSVEKLEGLILELEAELDDRFGSGIKKISTEFNRFFTLMFGGGGAELTRVKSESRKNKTNNEIDELLDDELVTQKTEAGIEISVNLPNKRVKGLDMLSGGERALTSIALIFAMSQVNPPLFVILDETDAALDEANSRRYGDMIEALSKKSQLILITHNRETMSRAGILYGVTMSGDGMSKLLSVRLNDALAVAK